MNRPPSAPCAKPPKATTSPSKPCRSKEKTGANFADFAANAKELTGNKD